jgi:hypothetical protein
VNHQVPSEDQGAAGGAVLHDDHQASDRSRVRFIGFKRGRARASDPSIPPHELVGDRP